MVPTAMDTNTPARSAAITAIAWLAIAVGGLGSIISFITAAMFAVGSYGTKNANALDALISIVGPPVMLVAGVGSLRRKRIAWFTFVAILFAMLAWKGAEFLKPVAVEDRTFIDANGVQTTIMGGGATHSLPFSQAKAFGPPKMHMRMLHPRNKLLATSRPMPVNQRLHATARHGLLSTAGS